MNAIEIAISWLFKLGISEPAKNAKDEYIALVAERDSLRAFAGDLLSASGWVEGDIDGGDFQDIAVKHGVLVETVPDKPCGRDECKCVELYSDEEFSEGLVKCYRRNPAWEKPHAKR